MQSPVAAIRAAHPRTSFVRQSGRSRERHLGLRGGALPRLVSAPRTAPGGRIDALRGQEIVPEAPRPRTSPLRRTPAFRWSSSLASTERGAVARRATPWRG
jgi:hypothetical protein